MNYQLTRKNNMKRIVMRVKDGEILVSAPIKVPKTKIDEFVLSKTAWIEKQLANPPIKRELKQFSDLECLEKFNRLAENIYPLIAHKIKTQPKIYVKDYKSRWGTCYHKRGYIILNKQLLSYPDSAIEQVILHEYVHFLVQNHSAKFHKIMQELMPDYLQKKSIRY